ncbi:MAG: hypothetical protein ACLFO6_01715 [Archaeoglobaceae archaeon]
MRIYLLLVLMLGFSFLFSGCSDVLPLGDSSTGPYDIEQRVWLRSNFIPVMDVNITGTPRDMYVELETPKGEVKSTQIFADNFTDQTGKAEFTLAEPGDEVTTGGYEIRLRSQGEVISSKSFTLEEINLVVQDARFNITGNTINSITLTIKNEGVLPAYIQQANVKVGDQDPKGWLFTRGVSPQETTTMTIPREFEIRGDTVHVNVWFYYQGDLVADYETDVSAE